MAPSHGLLTYAGSAHATTERLRLKIVMMSMVDAVLSTTLWAWAFITCVTSHFDGGVIVFAITAVAGVMGLYSTTSHYQQLTSPSVRLVMFSHGLATLFFTLRAIKGNSRHQVKLLGGIGFRIYCVIMAVFWMASGVSLGAALQRWRKKSRKPRTSDHDGEVHLPIVASLLPSNATGRKELV